MNDPATLYSFGRNLVVVASAGTGKTHALVGVLVHLLMGGCSTGRELRRPIDPSRLVATTFSRKAAAEIRARLALELERLVNDDDRASYRQDLLLACDRAGSARWSEAEIAARARTALDGLGRAEVGTLHSYATSLVRAHALEQGLSPGFELADEAVSRERTLEAVGRVLDARADAADGALRALVTAAGGIDRLQEDIAAVIERIAEDGRSASELTYVPDEAADVEARMESLVRLARGLQGDRALGGPSAALVTAYASGDPAAVVGAAAGLCAVPARGAKSALAEEFFVFRAELPGATNAERGRNLGRFWRARGALAPCTDTARSVLIECEAAIRRDAQRDGVLSFGDVLQAARDILRDRPDIAAEVTSGIEALLVDEFQDTSPLQRDLVKLLWEQDPSRRTAGTLPSLAAMRPRGLLLVGDRKQSIYGFRGADVAVFAEVCVGLAGKPAREALGIPAGQVWEPEEPIADFVALRHNRRGRDELLSFANAYSRLLLRPSSSPPELFEVDYVPATEDLLPPPERPASAPRSRRTVWLPVPLRGDATCSTRLDEAGAIARHIVRLVGEGRPSVRGAAPRWRDVAVLAQRHETLDATAFALARAGAPYVFAGKGFYAAREVRDLASMLGLVLNPGDKLALLEVLRGPWAGVSDETLLGLTDPHRGLAELGSWDAGERRVFIRDEDGEGLALVRRVVERLRRVVDRLGPAEVLREAVRAFGLEEVLILLPRGEQRVANVRKLIAVAQKTQDARAFLAELDRAVKREVAEAEAGTFSDEDDAVRLLTVHASKGLDFPIVFLPEAGAQARPVDRRAIEVERGAGDAPSTLSIRFADDEGFVHESPAYARSRVRAARREAAERARLAYVGATRASEAMFFVGDRRVPGGSQDTFRRTTAGILRELASDEATRASAELEVAEVDLTEPCEPPPRGPSDAASAQEAPPPRPAWRSLPIATTALQDFHHCHRRFQLTSLLEMPERMSAGPAGRDRAGDGAAPAAARAEGTLAHRLLERVDVALFGRVDASDHVRALLAHEGLAAEPSADVVERVTRFLRGAYATRVAKEGAEVRREQPFVLRLDDEEGRTVVLRGTIDLLVLWPDARVDVIDYKRARVPSAEPYLLQLEAYALAAEEVVPGAKAIRAGLVFLGNEAPDPLWCPPIEPSTVRAKLAALGAELVEARWSETFSRVPVARCRAIHCGYVGLCHGVGSERQLSLFGD